jgi:hypothetical protein
MCKTEHAKTKKTPRFVSTRTTFSVKGIKAQANKANNKDIKGASTNTKRRAFRGKTDSFIINFNASAKGCRTPSTPTTLGPFLFCVALISFLSSSVIKAILNNRPTTAANITTKKTRYTIILSPQLDFYLEKKAK